MYLLGFGAAYLLINHLSRLRNLALSKDGVSDLLFYGVLGVVLGGRLGYVMFYNPAQYLSHPLEIFAVWQGGMSFHGGALGVVTAGLIFCWHQKLPILLVGDIVTTSATIGLGLGRIGNFINGELWGRVTELPWGVVFPGGGPLPRHPSQLYEAALEGIALFIIMSALVRIKGIRTKPGMLGGIFISIYGAMRIFVEFFREPDQHLGYYFSYFTMGQFLSLPMIIIGCYFIFRKAKLQR
jgi:phosphatidylglycerol:prolipoprotein diacylglycerol transferase